MLDSAISLAWRSELDEFAVVTLAFLGVTAVRAAGERRGNRGSPGPTRAGRERPVARCAACAPG
ncbi:hypothetical protein ACWGJJ_26520, partial [Streptomyces sp. NPDC054787]